MKYHRMLMYQFLSLLIIVIVTSAQDGTVGRRVPSFIASRGKKNEADVEKEVSAFDYEPVDKLDHSDDVHYPMTKRAHFGFQGTRGKKMSDFSYKRAMGFTASRGKKYDPLMYPKTDIDDYWLLRNELAKRKFYGMRGKKLPYYSLNVMGVRGKKGPSTSTFFGTRGKKDDIPLVNNEDDNSIENLATIMYLLSTDKDFSKHHTNEDFDFEGTDTETRPQEQLLAVDDSSA